MYFIMIAISLIYVVIATCIIIEIKDVRKSRSLLVVNHGSSSITAYLAFLSILWIILTFCQVVFVHPVSKWVAGWML